MEGAWGMEETYQCDREGVENALQSQYSIKIYLNDAPSGIMTPQSVE